MDAQKQWNVTAAAKAGLNETSLRTPFHKDETFGTQLDALRCCNVPSSNASPCTTARTNAVRETLATAGAAEIPL